MEKVFEYAEDGRVPFPRAFLMMVADAEDGEGTPALALMMMVESPHASVMTSRVSGCAWLKIRMTMMKGSLHVKVTMG